MKRNVLGGALLAVLSVLALGIGSALQLPLNGVLFAGGVGYVLGTIRSGSPLARMFSFLIGFLLVWIMYGVLAQFLPQGVTSQMITTFVVVIILTLIAVLTKGKMPLWALILGAATMTGAYQTAFGLAPQNFLSESVSAAGGTLFGVALGLIAAGLVGLLPSEDDPNALTPATTAPPATNPAATTDAVGVEILKG